MNTLSTKQQKRNSARTTPKPRIPSLFSNTGANKPISSLFRRPIDLNDRKTNKTRAPPSSPVTLGDNQVGSVTRMMSTWNIRKKKEEEEKIQVLQVDQDYKARVLAKWANRMSMNV